MAIKCFPADLVRWEKAPLGFKGYKNSKEIYLRVAYTLPSHGHCRHLNGFIAHFVQNTELP